MNQEIRNSPIMLYVSRENLRKLRRKGVLRCSIF
jgi:hypothetical protein